MRCVANDFLTIILSDKFALLSPLRADAGEDRMIVTEWLRAKFISKSDEAVSSSNGLLSDLAKNSEQILWLRVNDLVGRKNNHFHEAHAEDLAGQTIKIACEKTQSAELAKCAAEAELARVKGQIETIICQHAEQMEQAAFQLAVTEKRVIAAEQRATAAVERANKAEASLTRLQAEILAKTIMKKLVPRAA